MHAQGMLYPPVGHIHKATIDIAAAIAEVAYAKNLATFARPKSHLHAHLANSRYRPDYLVGNGAPSNGNVPPDEPFPE